DLDEPRSQSPYAYAWNNPVWYDDPTGMMVQGPGTQEGKVDRPYFDPYVITTAEGDRIGVRILGDDEELDPDPNGSRTPTFTKHNPQLNGVTTEPREASTQPTKPKPPKESISTQPGYSPPANSSDSGSGQAGPPPGARGFHGASGEYANSVPTWARPVVDLAGYAYVAGYALVTAPARLARGVINFADNFSRMDWEQRTLTVTQILYQVSLQFSVQGMVKSWLNQAQSYWDYANDPFAHQWAAWNYITSGGTDGLAYQTGDFIGTNLTIGAITGAAGAPFAGGGGVTSIFNGETVPWRKSLIPLDDPLIDNNILTWIANKEPSAIAFANQYKNKLSINRTIVKEFLHKNTGHTVPQLRQIMQDHGIQLIPSATRAEATALLPAMGKTALNNDRILVATAHKYGIRFATSDYDALNAARRLGVDVRGWRVIDNGTAAPWYASVKNKLKSQGVKNPELFIGPENPW
ncbi:hypothetical protein HY772_10370, partial [Candidatus Woesearchaeota archaeon]|nr:hypothetical protein [Candidatus Woesearchaeota archaeon]